MTTYVQPQRGVCPFCGHDDDCVPEVLRAQWEASTKQLAESIQQIEAALLRTAQEKAEREREIRDTELRQYLLEQICRHGPDAKTATLIAGRRKQDALRVLRQLADEGLPKPRR